MLVLMFPAEVNGKFPKEVFVTKEQKIKSLMKLCGLDENLKAFTADLIGQNAEDQKFVTFVYDTIFSTHLEIFQQKFSEEVIDELISFFSNKNLQNSLALMRKLSDEALQICDSKVEKYIEEEDFENYVQSEADKGEVN